MYAAYFGLQQAPFSIAPDPRYLYLSERHREALAHLLYGVGAGGGFVLLSGEIGAGKTTVCRGFLEQIPPHCRVAYIFNPKLTVAELLQTVCDEWHIVLAPRGGMAPTAKDYTDALNAFLLQAHAAGDACVLIIDEAQNLSPEVLEQLRLLTNLETRERKLLQIILIGQPELRDMLAQPGLEQLAQRVVARFHLSALNPEETRAYLAHRLAVAGWQGPLPFSADALDRIQQLSRGVPRRINLLCDRALLGTYAQGRREVDSATVAQAAREVFGEAEEPRRATGPRSGPASPAAARQARGTTLALGLGFTVAGVALGIWGMQQWHSARGLAQQARPVAALAPAASQPASAAASSALASSVPPASAATASSGPGPDRSPVGLATGDLTASQLWTTPSPAREALARLWSEDLATAAAQGCEVLARQGHLCHAGRSHLGLLRALDRPALLRLEDVEGRQGEALLLGVDAGAVQLAGPTGTAWWPQAVLARHWRGEYLTLWEVPPGYLGPVGPGASGPQVASLARSLAQALGEPTPAASAPRAGSAILDTELQARLQRFQAAQGLAPDAWAGPIVFMQLNRVLGSDEPHLQSRR